MAILGNFWTTMKQKQSMVIFVNYKDNYDTTRTTANNSMGFDPIAIQFCFRINVSPLILNVIWSVKSTIKK